MLALILIAGCQSLRLPARLTVGASDWPTSGGSAERRHATMHRLPTPLAETWTYDAGAGFGASAAMLLDEDAVLVATRQGEVHAIKLDDGDKLGYKEFGASIEDAPTVRENLLYVPVAWKGEPLVAYDLRKGKTRWTVEGAPVPGSPLLYEDHVIVAHEQGAVASYDARSGKEQWRDAPDSTARVRIAPVKSGSRVLVSDVAGRVRALDVQTGARRWTRRLGAPVYETAAAREGIFLVPTTRGQLYALEAASGRTRWQFQAEGAAAPIRLAKPAVDDSLVVAAGSDGRVHALNPATGAVRWTFNAHEAVVAPPLLTPERVFVGAMNGKLVALNRHTGKKDWEHKLEGRVKTLLPVGPGALVVLTEPNVVHLFSSQDEEALAHAR